jgi:hypothetical protein
VSDERKPAKGRIKLSDADIVSRPLLSRRAVLIRLGTGTAAATSLLLTGCVEGAGSYDADSYDGVSSGGGTSGGGTTSYSDSKWGDGADYTVYADFQDLDSDAVDVSDHAHTRSADAASNDYD